jgi:spermidine synthase
MWRLYLSIPIISASAIAAEIVLMRLMAVAMWYHFAYMIISLALLGYGVSGSFLAILRRRILPSSKIWIALIPLFLSIALPLCFRLSQMIHFDPFLMMWDLRHFLRLFARYLILMVPFFLAGSFTGLCIMSYSPHIGRIYLFDLAGAGMGSVGAIGLLFAFKPTDALSIISAFSFIGVIFASWHAGYLLRSVLTGLPILAAVNLIPLKLDISQYKYFVAAERMPEARVLHETSSPLGVLTALRSPALRIAPGLSMAYRGDIPPQIAVFTDADSPTAITSPHEPEKLAFLDHLTNALPYAILERPKVLVIGAGGGMDVLSALTHGAREVVAVELNPQMVEMVSERFSDFAGGIYSDPRVRVVVGDARGFVERTDERFDLIQISLVESFRASAAGVYALSESYLYTIEAFKGYLNHLTENGVLCITRWSKIPPVDTMKVIETIDRLRFNMPLIPQENMAFIRSWATDTIILKRSKLTEREIEAIKRFCEEKLYDLVYYPGIPAEEALEFEGFLHPSFHPHLRGNPFGRWRWMRRMFNLEPATDNKPYFFHFFRWRSLPYLVRTMGRNWLILVEWGYVMLVATLIQAIAASALLILLPLRALPRQREGVWVKLRTLLYFGSLGFGFMAMEIALIQLFSLFLSDPIYSVAAVIGGMLVVAGLGSLCSRRFSGVVIRPLKRHPGLALGLPFGVIIPLSAAYRYLPRIEFALLGHLSLPLRISLTILSIAPLAFFMGMPFPMGIRHLRGKREGLIPWAWGVNGCASVVGAVGAMIIALSFGHNVLLSVAAGCYLLAASSGLIHVSAPREGYR